MGLKDIFRQIFNAGAGGDDKTEIIRDGKVLDRSAEPPAEPPQTALFLPDLQNIKGKNSGLAGAGAGEADKKPRNPPSEPETLGAQANPPSEPATLETQANPPSEPAATPALSSQTLSEPKSSGMKSGRPPSLDFSGYIGSLAGSHRAKGTLRGYTGDLNFWKSEASRRFKKSVYSLKIREIESIVSVLGIAGARRKMSALKGFARWLLRDGYPNLYLELQKFIAIKGKKRIPKYKEEQEFLELRALAKELISVLSDSLRWLIGLFSDSLCFSVRGGFI